MQSKKIIIGAVVLLFLVQLSIPMCFTFAQNDLVIDQKTKERLAEQYGLEEPQPPTSKQKQNILLGADWGFSSPAGAVVVEFTILIRNPLIFISQQLLRSLK
ncbi:MULTISPECIES: hypothetical protein [Paenibacillus]|nr:MULTISPECIES: hypothetical protein [Paenibacillus]AJE50447.1 hypothetical protein RE92_04935 [Paenibacillus polymyxa]AZH28604.1 hypothetical protein EGM68_07415 [Paenibacillus sp. M-152]QOH61170.1 hypothetical protein DI243_07010 [Paenibacillus polymyxa]